MKFRIDSIVNVVLKCIRNCQSFKNISAHNLRLNLNSCVFILCCGKNHLFCYVAEYIKTLLNSQLNVSTDLHDMQKCSLQRQNISNIFFKIKFVNVKSLRYNLRKCG